MNFIFHIPGDAELKASSGHVPEAFYDAIQQVVEQDFVYAYDGGFVHSVAMHDRLYKPNAFSSYAIFRFPLPLGTEEVKPEWIMKALAGLKETNFARPVVEHFHYQVFSMETIDTSFDDD